MKSNTNYAKAVHLCIFINIKDKKLINSTELAESVNTNPVVIRRLVASLKEAGIIASIPGVNGGFFLGRSPEEITLWDIYLATKDEEFFKRPKVNPDCVVSSNLKVLLYDSSVAAEHSMKNVLNAVTISALSTDLKNNLSLQGVEGKTSD